MPYDNMPFKNKQAAKSDRTGVAAGGMTPGQKYDKLQEMGKSVPKSGPTFSVAERDAKLSKIHMKMKEVNPVRFKRDLEAGKL